MMGGTLSFSLLEGEGGSVWHPSIGKAGFGRRFEVGLPGRGKTEIGTNGQTYYLFHQKASSATTLFFKNFKRNEEKTLGNFFFKQVLLGVS